MKGRINKMDLTFKTEKGRFNYRVGAIIIQDGKVLVVKNSASSYYYSVGGRVHYNETCEEAVKREVREEVGIEMDIDRAVFFHEQFFDEKDTREHFHEISLYYLMKIPDNLSKMMCSSITENGVEEQLIWLPINRLDEYVVFPRFFQTELLHLPMEMKNIVDIQNR